MLLSEPGNFFFCVLLQLAFLFFLFLSLAPWFCFLLASVLVLRLAFFFHFSVSMFPACFAFFCFWYACFSLAPCCYLSALAACNLFSNAPPLLSAWVGGCIDLSWHLGDILKLFDWFYTIAVQVLLASPALGFPFEEEYSDGLRRLAFWCLLDGNHIGSGSHRFAPLCPAMRIRLAG